MYYYRKIVRTGIAVMLLCSALTVGCSAAPLKTDTLADTENGTETVVTLVKEETTAAVTTAEPTSETEATTAVSTGNPASESTSAAVTKETTEKETAAEETVSESPLEIKEIPGISAVAGYVTSGEPYDKYWSELSLEIAASFYKDFIPCAVGIDGIWKKGLYNEEHNLLVVQNDETVEYLNSDGEIRRYTLYGETYTIYHGEEEITVPIGIEFPLDVFVRIELTDVNGDGKDELFIHASPKNNVTYLMVLAIHIDPFVLMTDVYDESGENSFVPQCRVVSAEVTEEGMAKVTVEFILENGETYVFDREIEGADLTCLDQYEIHLYQFWLDSIAPWTNEESDEWELVSYKFLFEVEQPGIWESGAWIRLIIGLEYDDEAKYYRQGDDVTIEEAGHHWISGQ